MNISRIISKLIQPRIVVNTYSKKQVDERQQFKRTTDKLRNELNLPPIKWSDEANG